MNSFSGLLNNAALMLVLCVIYDTFNIYAISSKALRDILTGSLVGLIAIAVMLNPWSLTPGVFFDTRWVLLSLCGLFFGFSPTVIAVTIAGAFRLHQGGAGGVVGTIVILSTAFVGVGWKYWKEKNNATLGGLQLYCFGFLVQLVMLSCMSLMPQDMRMTIIKSVAPPILVIFPFLTMLVGLVLKKQEDRRAADKMLLKEIQERKIAEDAAWKSEAHLQSLIETLPDLVWLKNPEGVYIKCNKKIELLFGSEATDIIGKTDYDFLDSEKAQMLLVHDQKAIAAGKPSRSEYDLTYENDGHTETIETIRKPIYNNDGKLIGVLGVGRDITERKKLEAELLRAQKMESIGTLAGGIAHDFNNILSAIMGYAELALDENASKNDIHDHIDQIMKSSARAAELVRQILTFSRKSDHHLEPVFPHLIVKEALKMLRASTPSTIQIKESIDQDCGQIMADQVNIHQVIVNLFTNALHAMENQKGILEIKLYRKEFQKKEAQEIPGAYPGEFIVLEIGDTGHGMDTATIKQIYDPFFTTKEVGKGTGLGLSVIHGIIKDYNGFIQAESLPGTGSIFSVHFPLLDRKMPPEQVDVIDVLLPTGSERILFVDDESMIVALNQKILERLGYSVYGTTSSPEALAVFQAEPERFDLIITDQTMPAITGMEFAREIFKIRDDIPVIICTGYSSSISEPEVGDVGIKKQLNKPVSRKILAETIRQVLDAPGPEGPKAP